MTCGVYEDDFLTIQPPPLLILIGSGQHHFMLHLIQFKEETPFCFIPCPRNHIIFISFAVLILIKHQIEKVKIFDNWCIRSWFFNYSTPPPLLILIGSGQRTTPSYCSTYKLYSWFAIRIWMLVKLSNMSTFKVYYK